MGDERTVGVDLDNTLACYDGLFHRLAVERGLIGPETPRTKTAVRDCLRAGGREAAWTELQGTAYGARMSDAPVFDGAIEALRSLVRDDWRVFIVSHRSRQPYAGPRYDLHGAATAWLEQVGMFDADVVGLSRSSVFLEETREQKAATVCELGVRWFVDDLPEFLCDSGLPPGLRRVHFDPSRLVETPGGATGAESWGTVLEILRSGGVG